MKKLLFLLTLTAAVSCNTPQELAVMTLNMRYDNPEDGMNNWRFRRERIAGLIRSEAVDLLGTQEVLANQFDDLQALLPGYRAVGVGREDGARAGEFNAVFFRSDRFELLDSGVFWLSEEPETPGSKGWDGACERLATWTVLRDKSGRELLFINTHLDHVAVFTGLSVEAEVALTVCDTVNNHAGFVTGVADDLTHRFFHSAENDLDTGVLFGVVALDFLDGLFCTD